MSVAEAIISTLRDRGMTMAIAESLTGGLLVAELVSVPGASVVLRGGVVAYDTAIKHSVLGVDAELLAVHGPVHPEVARQMADRVRTVLAVDGKPADVGLSTTGVAGPGSQDGHPEGTVYLGFAIEGRVFCELVRLDGGREAIRRGSVSESLLRLQRELATG